MPDGSDAPKSIADRLRALQNIDVPLDQTKLRAAKKLPTPSPAVSSTPKVSRNTAFPNDLLPYIRDYNVLLIDIRNRVDFEREHIKANSVICIEPPILMREG